MRKGHNVRYSTLGKYWYWSCDCSVCFRNKRTIYQDVKTCGPYDTKQTAEKEFARYATPRN